ncbi:MAG TPA: SAM-dependent methyltransferase [Herpetosiphonaceae bacterium]
MDDTRWRLEEIPEDKPNPARMYDYFLGGHHNFAVDRAAADRVRSVYPDVVHGAQANRAFLRRVVRFMGEQGIDQFLDLGSGIPTAGNVHEVAQRANPAARVVYVDVEPVAVIHSAAILRGNERATIVEADARQPEEILKHPEVQRLLDFSKPIGVLMLALLHFVTDDQAAQALVRRYREALVPGSFIAITHASLERVPAEIVTQFERVYSQTTTPIKTRGRAQVEPLFKGLDLVDPGVIYVPLWRPEGPDDVFLDQPERSINLGGVGRVR